ncbi:50S ribosomal protein L9 [Parvularcula marina]|uniref:Large ribosomal subunit protein bL9 n=1 Tax=Parvularcula marina TaxID=2292771 RepID=A0A371RGH7_9PROT|nr:50S ribosomal protein L9 [Parvularcula marina]RFB04548.1 50S ribosomal protein L9 [Parvularcula marina]
MQVILLERVEKLGSIGDEVSVKDGFARNFLLPNKKALRATAANRAVFEARRATIESENAESRQKAENLSSSIADKTFVVIRSASDMGQLYGSVSSRDIAEIASTKKLKLDKSMVLLNAPIKELGIVPVKVRLHPEVFVDIKINVARSEEEADAQERGENVLAKKEEEIESVVGTGDFDEFGDASADAPADAGAEEDTPAS